MGPRGCRLSSHEPSKATDAGTADEDSHTQHPMQMTASRAIFADAATVNGTSPSWDEFNMGYEKRRMERLKQEHSQGYCAPGDRFVCSSCVTDRFLSDALKGKSGERRLQLLQSEQGCAHCSSAR